MIRSVEDYLAQHPNEVSSINSQGTTDDNIRANASFYGYDRNSSMSIAEQYSYDQLKMFSDMPLLSEAIKKFEIIKKKILLCE